MARPQGCGRRRLLAACLGNEDVVRGPAAALTKRPAASSAAPRPGSPRTALRCAASRTPHCPPPAQSGNGLLTLAFQVPFASLFDSITPRDR